MKKDHDIEMAEDSRRKDDDDNAGAVASSEEPNTKSTPQPLFPLHTVEVHTSALLTNAGEQEGNAASSLFESMTDRSLDEEAEPLPQDPQHPPPRNPWRHTPMRESAQSYPYSGSSRTNGTASTNNNMKSIKKSVDNPFPILFEEKKGSQRGLTFGRNNSNNHLSSSHHNLWNNNSNNDGSSWDVNSQGSRASKISLMSYKSYKSHKSTKAEDYLDEWDDPSLFVEREMSRAVYLLKFGLVVFMMVAALSVALGVYYLTKNMEQNQFEDAVQENAAKILNNVGGSLDATLGAIDTYVVGLASFARYTNMKWPLVTNPDHAVKMAKMRALSKAINIKQYHLVQADDNNDSSNSTARLEWEDYSTQNDAWVQDAINVQQADQNYHGTTPDTYTTSPVLFNINGNISDNATGPFLPQWHEYPVQSTFLPAYNFDAYQDRRFQEALPDLLSRKAMFSEVHTIPRDPSDPVQVTEADLYGQWASAYAGPGEDPTEPLSSLYYPIMDCAADYVSIASDDNVDECNMVGVVVVALFWRELLKNTMSVGNKGMIAVMESSCNQTFSYAINGPDVAYLGPSDMHDPSYNHLSWSADLDNLDEFSTRDVDYTGLPVGSSSCHYRLHLYPAEMMEDDHTSNTPIISTVVIVIIFVFTTSLFLLYDRYNEKRQRIILHTALASTANVTILEQKVLERTAKLERSNQKLAKANKNVMLASARQLQTFASMSHEIRTPLNCIIGLSSLMQESQLEPKQAESLRMINTSGELLLQVVNDVLDYSKLEAGKVAVEMEQSSLQDALNAVVRSIETNALEKNVSVETYFDCTVGEFFITDSRRLQQILYNLLGNAIKFSSEEGVVELRLQHSRRPVRPENESTGCIMEAFGTEKVLRFVVKDYGKGIEKENFQKIFTPFGQADNSTERIYGGTGLGLAITAKLVRALGGSISVDSEVGEWTEMHVDFPCGEQEEFLADLSGLSARLQSCAISIVGNADERDVKDCTRVFDAYSVCHLVAADMTELIQGDSNDKDISVLLIHEDNYDETIYKRLSGSKKCLLLTFGVKFSVKSAICHYRSLSQILPSVLMARIADSVETAISQPGLDQSITPSVPTRKAYLDYRVLIAEDNLVNQKVLVRILKKMGVENVVVVDNGQKAVDQEATQKFDVVLMDMQMPVMDGIDACRYITERQAALDEEEKTSSAKVIFVTAHALDHFKEKCQAAGGAGFLSKPFRLSDLEETFEKLQGLIEGTGEGFW